nr:glycine cleavage system aminomethyltransferase GcvT [Planctomonas psychrotolerans]
MSASASERLSPLHAVHVAAGASFTDFAGWQMPVRYTSDLAEHHAVRTAAGIFDLSHMAEIAVRGTGAAAALDYALAGRLSALAIGQAKYSLLLTPDGGIVDDVVVYRLADDDFLVVANASNRGAAVQELTDRAVAFDARVVDESDATALIAVQGPGSRGILDRVTALDAGTPLAELRYYRVTSARFADRPVLIARTGYTGEDGFELYVPVDVAESLWTAIVQAGAGSGLVPAGLASRDTLRLEAGMPLYGSELGRDIFPAQAGLGRVVNLAKDTDFVGRHASENGPDAVARVLVGLASEGRRAGRAGYPVYASGDTEAVMEALEGAVDPAGIVTSGALSPTLGHPIAMAYVDPAVARPGTTVYIDVRGTRIPATVVPLPFYTRAS